MAMQAYSEQEMNGPNSGYNKKNTLQQNNHKQTSIGAAVASTDIQTWYLLIIKQAFSLPLTIVFKFTGSMKQSRMF
jgi:hypothetical protein